MSRILQAAGLPTEAQAALDAHPHLVALMEKVWRNGTKAQHKDGFEVNSECPYAPKKEAAA